MKTQSAIFIAGEYSYPDVETSLEPGNVALAGGAHGFGNGGSPRSQAASSPELTAEDSAP